MDGTCDAELKRQTRLQILCGPGAQRLQWQARTAFRVFVQEDTFGRIQMDGRLSDQRRGTDSTRRQFLKEIGLGAVAGGIAAPMLEARLSAASQTAGRKVKHLVLGKTGLSVSEI